MLSSECGELGEKREARRRAATCSDLGDEDAHDSGGVQIKRANGLIRWGLACGDREETCGGRVAVEREGVWCLGSGRG
ncbi:hypothetical protein BHE74_00039105 [Ensete ventricosum]|nr:hypothetical protein GW17_00006781 [Ensete ventricosum]RWW54316.1 hypothetical protein BHE74_00039105 [Ensete ventricosum]RZS18516.1 hypothetical protein BHM03_00050789 [Ensete ventricosum]